MQVVLVYLQPFWCNSLLKCVSQPKIAKNSLKPPILGVQGHSRSSMLTFLRRCPSFSPLFVGTPFNQWHETLSQNTRDSKLSYGENQKSLSHLGSDQYRVVTDRQTTRHQDSHQDIITITNMLALVRKKAVLSK